MMDQRFGKRRKKRERQDWDSETRRASVAKARAKGNGILFDDPFGEDLASDALDAYDSDWPSFLTPSRRRRVYDPEDDWG